MNKEMILHKADEIIHTINQQTEGTETQGAPEILNEANIQNWAANRAIIIYSRLKATKDVLEAIKLLGQLEIISIGIQLPQQQALKLLSRAK